jgi:hypothetical protein
VDRNLGFAELLIASEFVNFPMSSSISFSASFEAKLTTGAFSRVISFLPG